MGSKRKSSDENGDGEASPTRSGGSKRCCCDRRDRGYTLDEFMKKLNPRELQQVQQLCQKYGFDAPELSSRECKYRFITEFPNKLYTDTNFKAEIVLVDASNNVISSGPMATGKIEIIVLKGDIDVDENGEWTEEEFKNYVLEPRKGKGSLLIGNLPTRLCDGIGSISDARFTDNSSWTKPKTFRLGVRGMAKQVQEGISKDFRVLDRHMKGLQKDHPPSMNDKVYRLKGISEDGTLHKKLVDCQINTVSDLLSYCGKEGPEMLRVKIGMKKGNWKKAYGQALQSREQPDILLDRCLVKLHAPDQMIGMKKGNWEKTYGHALKSMERPDILLDRCLLNRPGPDQMIGMKKGNWEKTYGHALKSMERPDILLNRCLLNLPGPDQKGNWEKTYGHALKSMERPDILLDRCLLNLPGPDQNFCELNGSSSYQTSNVSVQHNVMSTSAQGMAVPIGVGFPLLRSKWLILVFVAWLIKAAQRAQKSKLSETSSQTQNDDELVFGNLSPFQSLTSIGEEELYELFIYLTS